ncbi:MFS transporter [Rhodococcus erythropolis]|uniref:MFS transporter n=1 Tax=Rhodococcus erythropolis TaxID=1833 RepID=UPI001E2DEB6C|nr:MULTISPECIES: MFS transporter [Rhodococcus erythropolis group]MCD2109008.1 MFS transporter [Rhodococcus qingshengii]MCZ4527934.1 MFS transporter [Rhodococcus erythropolis]
MKKGQVAFLTGTHVVNDLYQGAVPALLPFMMLERGYSYSAVAGITLAATGLSSVVQPAFGMLVDRMSRNWLVPTGFVTAATGIVVAAMSTTYIVTWLAIALAGIGIAAYHPPATNLARAAGGHSQKAMSVFSVGGTLGASLAPPFVTLVVGSLGLSGGYLLAVPAVVAAIWWIVAQSRSAGTDAESAQSLSSQLAANGPVSDDWRSFTRLVLVTVCWSIPYVTTLSLVSPYVLNGLNGSSSSAAIVLSSFTLAGAAGTLLGGVLADRRGRRASIRLGYLLAVPSLALLAAAPNVAIAELGIVCLGFAMFLPFAPQVTLAQDYLPNRPGTASGVTLGLAMSVGGIASPLFGYLADHYGPRMAIGATTAVLLVGAVIAFTLRDRRLDPEDETERELDVIALR